MSAMQRQVEQFHRTYGAPVADAPQPLANDRKELRIGLIREELKELEDALEADDLTETYDACIDILYVTFGLLVEIGLNGELGFTEVHTSNMSKLGDDHKPIISRGIELDGFPEGKVLKGPNYFRPNLSALIEIQRKMAE